MADTPAVPSYKLRRIRILNKAIDDLTAGAESATIATPAGNMHYTRADLDKLRSMLATCIADYNQTSRRFRTHPIIT
jgi:hypothetical protein